MSWISAAIGAASSFLGNRQQSGAAASLDKKTRAWHDQNYQRQMHHTLGSNDWGRVNAGESIDMIGRQRDFNFANMHQRQSMDIGMEYGLTPQEMTGSGPPGGVGPQGGQASLGNSASQASAVQAQAQDRAADRQTQLEVESMRNQTQLLTAAMQSGVDVLGQGVQKRGQDMQYSQTQMQTETQKAVADVMANANITSSAISAEATKTAARLSANAQMYSADSQRLNVLGQLKLQGQINDAQIAQMSAQTAIALQDVEIKKELHSERWAKLASSMSSENILASALAVKHGVPMAEVLKNEKLPDDVQRDLQAFADEVIGNQSWAVRETQGASNIIGEGLQELKNTLGNRYFGNR